MKTKTYPSIIFLCVLALSSFAEDPVSFANQATYSPSQIAPGTRYILLTSDDLLDSFQNLVNRRISQGFQGSIVSVETIESNYQGRDTQEKIRNWLKDIYKEGEELFLAIGGDDAIVPVRFCYFPTDPNKYISTDLYYADINGTWDIDGDGIYGEADDINYDSLLPEIYTGRIPIRDANDVQAYTEKVIQYETACVKEFANSMLYIVGGEDHFAITEYTDFIQPYWQAVPLHVFSQESTLWDDACCGYELTPEFVVNQINRGYHFVRYYGHAGPHAWDLHPGGFNTQHAASVTNPVPFVLWSGGCFGAAWDANAPHGKFIEPDPTRSEAFIRNPHGGAVAVIGHTLGVGQNPHPENFWKAVFETPREPYLGRAYSRALTWSAPDVNNENLIKVHYMFTLLGDPALNLLIEEEIEPKLQLFSPRTGEFVCPFEDPVAIRWNACGTAFSPDDRICIEYSDNSGLSWQQIPGAESLSYNGRVFYWEADDSIPRGFNYRLRLSLLRNPAINCQSSQDFFVHKKVQLTVASIPDKSLTIGISDVLGQIALETDSSIPVPSSDSITLVAPEYSNDLPFLCWANTAFDNLSNGTSYTFVIDQDTSLHAVYGYSRSYYINDEIAEENFAAGDDNNDGLSAQTPKRHINALLVDELSEIPGMTIHVSEGIYEENLILDSQHRGLAIIGAGSVRTVIDGGIDNSCIKLENSGPIRIEGLSLINGSAEFGGGINSNQAYLGLINCSLRNNSASTQGGGMCVSGGNTIIADCKFIGNAALHAGALLNRQQSTCTVTRTIFRENSANFWGGAVNNANDSKVTLRQCILVHNSTKHGAGAILNHNGGEMSLMNCTIVNNHTENYSGLGGGAILNEGIGGFAMLENCILWYNTPNQIYTEENNLSVTYSNLQGSWPGEGNNIDVDPLFADLQNMDYHLKSQTGRWDPNTHSWVTNDVTSLCIDAGDPNSNWSAELWPHGKRINMGAYGGTTEASMSLSDAGDIRDLNNDSFITWDDVLLLADKWDSNDAPIREDLNLDGVVDVNDLMFFESNWTLDADNSAPVFDSPGSQYVTVGGSYTFTADASDIDGDELTYIALGLPEGAEFSNQAFSWTPVLTGTYFVTFIVSDRNSLDYMTVQITADQMEEVSN